MNPKFADRHRAQLGFRVVEEPGRLRAEPVTHPMWPVVAWIGLIQTIVLVLAYRYDRENFPLVLMLSFLASPILIGILFAIQQIEVAKGPLLEIEGTRGDVALMRDERRIAFDDIEAVFVLTGWYEWTDWHRVAELSLVVPDEEGRPALVPVVLHQDPRAVEDLAERVARLIRKPVRRETLGWGERQRRARAR